MCPKDNSLFAFGRWVKLSYPNREIIFGVVNLCLAYPGLAEAPTHQRGHNDGYEYYVDPDVGIIPMETGVLNKEILK